MTLDLDHRDLLIKTSERLQDPNRWTQGTWHRWNSYLNLTHTVDNVMANSDNVRSCVTGALELVWRELGFGEEDVDGDSKVYVDALRALQSEIGKQDVLRWNDSPGQTSWNVAATLRRAAER